MDNIPKSAAILALKAKIAMKTHAFKEKSVERCLVQDQWIAFAADLTHKIQELTQLQQQVHEEQSRLDATGTQDLYSHMGETQRSAKIDNVQRAWTSINEMLKSATWTRIQSVLDTTAQYNDDQPVLSAAALRPAHQASLDPNGSVNLTDVVVNTQEWIQMARHRIQQQSTIHKSGEEDEQHDASRIAAVLASSSRHIASLQTMIHQLQRGLSQIQAANEVAARNQYIQLASSTLEPNALDAKEAPSTAVKYPRLKLCPLTPAELLQQENKLVHSLKKVSMEELTDLAADSVRRSNQKREHESLSSGDKKMDVARQQTPPAVDDLTGVIRKLEYYNEDDGDHDMEP
ncbi:hypothetical protein FI667_g4915, partial [Globisporangium splendens]